MLRHIGRPIIRQSYRSYCSPSKHGMLGQARSLSANDIMTISANKATRFVYLRTLPLVKQAELRGHIDTIAASIEKMTKSICEKHVTTVADDRAAVHLHTASLAIATHRVLSPHIKNQIRLSNIIRAGFGAVLLDDPAKSDESIQHKNFEKRRPDFWIVRAALWFSFDRMATVRKMTANMVRDFGSQFETESHDRTKGQSEQHELVVSKLYFSLCYHTTAMGKIAFAAPRNPYPSVVSRLSNIHAFDYLTEYAIPSQRSVTTTLCVAKKVFLILPKSSVPLIERFTRQSLGKAMG